MALSSDNFDSGRSGGACDRQTEVSEISETRRARVTMLNYPSLYSVQVLVTLQHRAVDLDFAADLDSPSPNNKIQ